MLVLKRIEIYFRVIVILKNIVDVASQTITIIGTGRVVKKLSDSGQVACKSAIFHSMQLESAAAAD